MVGKAYDGREALEQIPHLQPDIVLMDLKMPVMNGIQATRQIRQKYPHIRVLVLTTYADDEWLFDAIRSGAAGYLLKDTPRADLIEAIKGTYAGKTYVDPDVAGKLFSSIERSLPVEEKPATVFNLSEREREILQLLVRGLSNVDIAHQLYLSEGTVRNYASAIFTKLGVSDRTQAVIVALRHGLVSIE